MIKNAFVKNLYPVVSSFSVIMVLVCFLLLGYIESLDYPNNNGWYLLLLAFSLIVLFFIMGFYWIFQIVEIDAEGIRTKIFKKVIRSINWDDITEIKYTSVMRNPAYVILIKNEKNLNLDSRKSIKNAINYYAPPSIKDIL